MKTGPIQIVRMSKSEFCRLDEPGEGRYAKPLPPQLDLERLTPYLADSATARPGRKIPACQTCGVCCSHDPIVRVKLEESERLGTYIEITDDLEQDVVVDLIVKRDFDKGRCAHLAGERGRHVECGVYERRPDDCRSFEAGSDRCHEYRRMYGLEPQLSDEEVARLVPLLVGRKRGVITNAICGVNYVEMSVEPSATEPERFVTHKTISMHIHAAVDGDMDNWIELHTYDPSKEIWLESQFVGMTVGDARTLIASRENKGVSN